MKSPKGTTRMGHIIINDGRGLPDSSLRKGCGGHMRSTIAEEFSDHPHQEPDDQGMSEEDPAGRFQY